MQKTESINNLGPYAVALSFVIDDVQKNRSDNVRESYIECFSGIPLPKSTVQQWKKEKQLVIEGFRSATEEIGTALDFAYKGLA